MKDIALAVGALGAFLLYMAACIATLSCTILGYVVTVQAANWLLLIAEAIMAPLATVHGLGHIVGFWP
jgi:hypothetical protein